MEYTSESFVALLSAGHQIPADVVTSPLVGRLFRYPKAAKGNIDLSQSLNLNIDLDDPSQPINKPYSFFMGWDGLQMLAANGKDHVYETLLQVGITGNYIRDQLEAKNNLFALIVMPNTEAFPATWEGLFAAVVRSNPELKQYVDMYRDDVVNTDVTDSDVFRSKYLSHKVVEEAHIMKDKTIFLTPRRFLNNTERSVVDFRVLLWLWFSANWHFKGYGRTVDSVTGSVGVTEFLVPNEPLQKLVEKYGAAIIELDVTMPQKD